MVVVDKFRMVTHFILVKSTYKIAQIVDIFMKEVFRLHGVCILETSLYSTGYTGSVKYYIPSKNWWQNWITESSAWRYVMNVCDVVANEMGGVPSFSIVCMQ